MRVGFIGLGNLGLPVATNLLEAGNELTVYDLRPERMDLLRLKGAATAGGPREVAARSEVVFASLPRPEVCEEVALGEEGVLAGAAPGMVYVETSTTSPALVRRIGQAAGAKGVGVLDAGITKGVVHAAARKTNLIVGGDQGSFDRVKPLFDQIAERVFHVGGLGTGMTVKLVNNLMAMVNLVTTCEGLALGARAGLSPAMLVEIIGLSSGDSYQLRERGPRILQRDFGWGGVTVELAGKDCQLITDLARELEFPLYMTRMAHALYDHALAKGLKGKDRSAVIMLWEELLGREIAE